MNLVEILLGSMTNEFSVNSPAKRTGGNSDAGSFLGGLLGGGTPKQSAMDGSDLLGMRSALMK